MGPGDIQGRLQALYFPMIAVHEKHHHSSHTDSPPANQIFRASAREFANPVDYQHPCQSMARFADFLALRYDANRTRHSYYRQVRLIHEYGSCDPALLTEPYFLVTFTLPAQLRSCFFGPHAKEAFASTWEGSSNATAGRSIPGCGVRNGACTFKPPAAARQP